MEHTQIDDNEPATFEQAVRKTGFGKFNITLMALTFFGICSPMFETTNMSYIFASAQCDLDLSLQDKGYLNSMVYAGMIASSFFWGFLLDVLGRKKLMIFAYFIDASFLFLSGFSQSFAMLLLCKFFGGFIICGPFSAMAAYLSEFHSSSYRARIQVVSGLFTGIAQIILPLLAWGILPLPIKWSLFDGFIELHSWNIFLFVTGLCPFIAGTIFSFLSESPKFLMTSGKNEKALKVLQKVYSKNTGNSPESYPVKELVQEKEVIELSDVDPKPKVKIINGGITNIGLLFKSKYILKFALISAIQVTFMASLNMLRLWTPQLFQALEDYKVVNNGSTSDLCTMLTVLRPNPMTDSCSSNVAKPDAYFHSMIVAAVGVVSYILTGSVIHKLGKKNLLILTAVLGALICFSLIYSRGVVITMILISLFTSCGNICSNVILSVVVDVFPTSLRALALSSVMMIARVGVVLGNIFFPMLLEQGCHPPFLVVAGIIGVGGLLCFILPNTENTALK
ncbi:synaptic vesicle glycoprotein 2C-like [Diabrotica undecimpunctata]|uniref:synaptic vesicle glycoprotein 2C-like n=1 Tax=Diabrotica undecimpunctata TaxID=50387 RepID=UPI003B633363